MGNNRAADIDPSLVPQKGEAAMLYNNMGGTLTHEPHFGIDPLTPELRQQRDAATACVKESVDHIFGNIVNGNDQPFRQALAYYLDTTRQFAEILHHQN